MIVSMTGFAGRKGQGAGVVWSWTVRSVNGKGLDLRLRLPGWIDRLAVRFSDAESQPCGQCPVYKGAVDCADAHRA
jgi:uncharacterized protein YicC (UPF0701 family)